jgi:CHAD domain-containing protein
MALKQIGATAAQAGAAARERLRATFPTAKLKRLVRKLERVSKALESGTASPERHAASGHRRAWLWALEAHLARRATRVREAIDAVGVVYVPEQLHGVRIAVKKLRYAAELTADATRTGTAADIEALKAVQDVLGRLHDLDVLLIRAREAQASLSPLDLRAWRDLDSLVRALQDDCRQLHARYMRHRIDLLTMAIRMGAGTPEAHPAGRRTAS